MKPNKTIEQAADFKTAEEILQEAYLQISDKQSSLHSDVDPVLIAAMQEYAQQFDAKWVSVETHPADNTEWLCHDVDGLVVAEYIGGTWRELYNWNIIYPNYYSALPSPPTEVQKGEEGNG